MMKKYGLLKNSQWAFVVVGDGLQTAPVQLGFSIDELVIR